MGSAASPPPRVPDVWAAARLWAVRRQPYLARAVLALRPVVVAATDQAPRNLPVDDGWRVYTTLEELAGADVARLGSRLLHQVGHLLRHHAERRHDAEREAWNLATDAEINDDLREDPDVPEPEIVPEILGLPAGGTAEQYYDVLAGKQADEQAAVREADCGTGADGDARPWNAPEQEGLTRWQARLVEVDVARRIETYIRADGDVPAGWRRWVDDVLEPAVDWRAQLRATVRAGVSILAGRTDFSFRSPSRRAAATPDVVLPGLRRHLPRVAVVVDTSASMSDALVARALAEVRGVLTATGVARHHVRVVWCDAQAYTATREPSRGDEQPVGGAGTDLREGIRAAIERRPAPELLVILTDGDTPWPDRRPCAHTVVGLLSEDTEPPGWAAVVRIPVGGDVA